MTRCARRPVSHATLAPLPLPLALDSRDEINRVRDSLDCLASLVDESRTLHSIGYSGLARMLDQWSIILDKVACSEDARAAAMVNGAHHTLESRDEINRVRAGLDCLASLLDESRALHSIGYSGLARMLEQLSCVLDTVACFEAHANDPTEASEQ
jgi:hypothetical protein